MAKLRWLRLTLCSLLLFGLLWLSTFAFPRDARADWPDGVRSNYAWYVCTSFTVSTSEPYSEPECQELAFGISAPYWNEVSFSGFETCGPGSCALWVRRYLLAPVGVASVRLSCAISAFTNDEGFGSGTAQVLRGSRDGSHLQDAGVNLGANGSGLTTYWFTHTAGFGHDLGDLSHDPVVDYIDVGPQLAGYHGIYVQTQQSTSGTEVDTGAGVDCVVDGFTGSYVAPTPTPMPTATPSYPIWPTLIPWPTISLSPTITPVPPWDVDIGFTPTISDTECYVFIPAIPVTTTEWLDFFNIPVPEYDEIGVCTEPFDMSMRVGPWDVGRLAWLLVAVGCVVGVWRMFYSGG